MTTHNPEQVCPACGGPTETSYTRFDQSGRLIPERPNGLLPQRPSARRCIRCKWSTSYEEDRR